MKQRFFFVISSLFLVFTLFLGAPVSQVYASESDDGIENQQKSSLYTVSKSDELTIDLFHKKSDLEDNFLKYEKQYKLMQGTLPSGLKFTFGEPIYTNEFSEFGAYEWVVIDSELNTEYGLSQNFSQELITPNRIEPGWATYIFKAYWITRNNVKSISIYPNKSAKGWTKEKALDRKSKRLNSSHVAI